MDQKLAEVVLNRGIMRFGRYLDGPPGVIVDSTQEEGSPERSRNRSGYISQALMEEGVRGKGG